MGWRGLQSRSVGKIYTIRQRTGKHFCGKRGSWFFRCHWGCRRIFSTGFIIAALSTVPILNLVMPVVASAFMTHVFHEMLGNKPVTPV